MDPLITNGVDPALLRVLDKHGQERDPVARRKRPPAPEEPPANDEENEQEPGPDTPKHKLDDLA